MSDPYLANLLGDREKILLVTRQHWFQLLRAILFEIVLIIVTIIAVTVVIIFLPVTAGIPASFAALGYLLVLLPVISMLRDIFIWRNHKYVVTNLRVIQIFGIYNKNVTDSSLEKVNDVKMDQSIFGRMFNFGDIEILTASELGINRFTFIGDPVRFKTAMLNAKVQLEAAQQGHYTPPPTHPTAMDVPRLIQELAELRERGAITDLEFESKKARLLERI